MLHNAETLHNYSLVSEEQEIGKVKDLYFDDQFWTVRYLVVDTGGWLTGRMVLISPYAILSVDKEQQRVRCSLTKGQIEKSPSSDADLPVSRQFEIAYHEYYGWPYYWSGPYAWAGSPQPIPVPEKVTVEEKEAWDSHLRSEQEVRGYRIDATDGEIGHISDFIVDGVDWTIRYLVVDTRNWWPGRHVLVSPSWVEGVDWPSRMVSVDLDRDAIRQAPEYDEDTSLTRQYEVELFSHFNKKGYW